MGPFRRICGSFAVALLAQVVVGAAPVEAVVNGTLDSEHDSIGVLVGASLCTAVLIAPQLAMTTAYCAENPQLSEFRLGDDYSNPDIVVGITSRWIHPMYSGDSRYSVGIVRLATVVPGYTPVPLLRPWQDTLAVGQHATIVGYGVVTPPSGGTTWRHHAAVELNDIQPLELRSHISSGSGACYGDSGAPALVEFDSLGIQVGLVNYITGSCDDSTYYVRVSAMWEGFLDFHLGEEGMIFADDFETGATTFWD